MGRRLLHTTHPPLKGRHSYTPALSVQHSASHLLVLT